MARSCVPYHAKEGNVYHIFRECKEGMRIPIPMRRQGSGKKRLCPLCNDMKRGKRTI